MADTTRPRLVVIGPFPPPYQGVTGAFQMILESSLASEFNLSSLNMAYDRSRGPSPGGELSFTKLRTNVRRTWRLLRILQEVRPGIVYLPLSQTRLGLMRNCLWILLIIRNCHCVVHLHGAHFRSLYNNLDPLVRILVSQAVSEVDACIVLSDRFRSMFSGLIDDDKIFVVPNGISRQAISQYEFKAAMTRRRQGELRPLQAVFLSNLFEAKGFGHILEAAALLASRGDLGRFRFSLAGAWESNEVRHKWMNYLEQQHLGDRVNFLGVILGKEKFKLLLDSDVFVLPSLQVEGQPVSIIEGMAAGLPIIATDQGCIAEMVQDGINGFIVPKGNSTSIANKLQVLRDNPDLRFRMGEASRSIYLESYTEDAFIGGLRRVFLGVLGETV